MNRTLVAALGAAALALAGCGGKNSPDAGPGPGSSTKSLSQQFCEKADACKYLPAGMTVQSCVGEVDACVGSLGAAEKSEWEGSMKQCVAVQDCSGFWDYYWNQVPYC